MWPSKVLSGSVIDNNRAVFCIAGFDYFIRQPFPDACFAPASVKTPKAIPFPVALRQLIPYSSIAKNPPYAIECSL